MQLRLPLMPDVPAPAPTSPIAPPGDDLSRVEFVRHPRARRYVIRVRDDGCVRVTIPRGGSKRVARAFAGRERRWIERERARQRTRSAPIPPPPEEEPSWRAIAKRELPLRLLALAREQGLSVTRVSIRNQRWRWGSCSRTGHICLNWRLVLLPAAIRDYVMIHELMHLKRMDHSPKFWRLVAEACPGYQDACRWLRDHAGN